MKKYVVIIVLVISMMMSACTIGAAPVNVDATQEITPIATAPPQETQAGGETSESQPEITPEPTQQFIEDVENQPTAYIEDLPAPTTVNHEDILGLYYLVMWEDVDVASDLIFYEIVQYMMNVLPYGNAPTGRDYNYTFSNGVMDFGDGPYDVLLDQDVLVIISQSSGKMSVFQPVTESEIPNIIAANDTSHSVHDAEDDNNRVLLPLVGSGREGNPVQGDEAMYTYDTQDGIMDILDDSQWRTFSYMYADGTYDAETLFISDIAFYPDYSFIHNEAFGQSEGLYEMQGTSLELFYPDGTPAFYPNVYIVENLSTGWYYLYLEDNANPGCYIVYEGVKY